MIFGKRYGHKNIWKFLLLVMLFMLTALLVAPSVTVPAITIADDSSPGMSEIAGADDYVKKQCDSSSGMSETAFTYDGMDKYISMESYISLTAITWTVTYDDGTVFTDSVNSSVNIGADVCSGTVRVNGEYIDENSTVENNVIENNVIENNTGKKIFEAEAPFHISKRNITVKPVDVNETFKGQAITPTDIEIISGSLVNGHNIDKRSVVMIGFNNIIGNADSHVDQNSVRIYAAGANVTKNYDVGVTKGKLTLKKGKNYQGNGDEKGSLAGPSTSKPPKEKSSSNNTDNTGNTGNTGNTEQNTDTGMNSNTSDGSTIPSPSSPPMAEPPAHVSPTIPDDIIADIPNDPVPMAPAIPDHDNNVIPSVTEANINAGLAIFFAIFMIISIIAIHLIERWRRKRKTYQ